MVQRRVEWSDTDASGHWHHGATLRWLEAAECLLLERLGVRRAIYHRLVRVHQEFDYHHVLQHMDVVDTHLQVERVSTTSITYRLRVTNQDRCCVSGRMVCVLLDPDTRKPTPWPDELRHHLEAPVALPPETLSSSWPPAGEPSNKRSTS